MIDDKQLLMERRSIRRPQWKGMVPEALFARLAHEPVAGDALCGLGDALLTTAEGRMLSFVALRCGAVRDCLYEWAGHCRIALERPSDRLTADEIGRIAIGPPAFTGTDAEVLQAIDDLLAGRRLNEATRAALGGRELILTIATLFYDTVAAIMGDAEPDAQPVAGLETPAAAARSVGR